MKSLAERLDSLEQLSDLEADKMHEQIDKIEHEELPQLEEEYYKYLSSTTDGRSPNERKHVILDQIEEFFYQIKASIFSICEKYGFCDLINKDTIHICSNQEEDDDEYASQNREYSIVVNRIAKIVLRKIGVDDNDYRLVDIMETILMGIIFDESDGLITAKAFAELVAKGFFLDKDEIKKICMITREKCQMQILGLKLAFNSIRVYNCSSEMALSQVAFFLSSEK